MSAPVYWVEDEPHLLRYTMERLNERVESIALYTTAADALAAIPRIRSKPGPIISCLYMPSGAGQESDLFGPEVGLRLIQTLKDKLLPNWPIFILSSNVSVDIVRRLDGLGIPRGRVFSKPLLEGDSFIEAVANATTSIGSSEPEDESRLIVVRPSVIVYSAITAQLLAILRDDPSRLKSLTPQVFEELIAERLEKMGFTARLSGRSSAKDGGVDLIAVPKEPTLGSILLAAQVKHHSTDRPTGLDAVDRLLAWKGDPFHLGLLVTNTTFTDDAIWKATQPSASTFIRLRDEADLTRWLRDDFSSPLDAREIPKEVQLRRGLTITLPYTQLGRSFEVHETQHPDGT